MWLRAARIGRQPRLAYLLVAIHPGRERVLCAHAVDFATSKVPMSSTTLLAGNGHSDRQT
jgi:hypothetical protein